MDQRERLIEELLKLRARISEIAREIDELDNPPAPEPRARRLYLVR